ncbi:gas vesicle protein GvpL [Oceanobacillus piezotolerans]|uniref:Gas vesicle protein GvpL n=1 Tax=Oceanobacillus piezotolerans TaxID=2448030 RepID=A0A498DF98_9BACI|nr:GvpL/GvpF family gas vesicle protein [Oceanobacillus piezotolerans]RLL42688.1 gas vesicle protein GvpL [Oceanobacillus piezotolerans]
MDSLIYLYGVIPTAEKEKQDIPAFKGIDEEHEVYTVSFGEITAVVCNLDEREYGQEQLEKKTNNPTWLHEKAFHHHEVLMSLYAKYPIIPMKFCTIYASMDNLLTTLETHKQRMIEVLESIKGKEEWILKIYCDEDKVKESVASYSDVIELRKEEIAAMSPGRQYLEKKKLGQLIEQEAHKQKQAFGETIHQELADMSANTEVKRNWNKDVTGRKEEMCWNSVYMLEKPKVDDFLKRVKAIQNEHGDDGWKLEVTGPWPSYHFSAIS